MIISKDAGATFSTYTKQDGIGHDNINSITVDEQNNLYLATSVGVARSTYLFNP